MIGKRKYLRTKLRKANEKGKKVSPDFLASCEGKIRYPDYGQAKIAADGKPSVVKPYKCRHGNHYHIGRRKA